MTLLGTSGIVTPSGSQVPSVSIALVRCSNHTASIPPVSIAIATAARLEPMISWLRGAGAGPAGRDCIRRHFPRSLAS